MGSNSLMLVQLFGIALLVYVPLVRFAPFRRLVGFADIRSGEPDRTIEQRYVDVIARAGRDAPARHGDRLVFRTTPGLRIVVPVLLCLLIFQLVILGFGGVADIASFLLIVAAAIWFGFYTWAFRVVVEGSRITWTGLLLNDRSQDLAKLKRAERDSSGGYRLEFEDRSTAYLHRYVEGHGVLKDLLLATLDINGR